MRIPLLEGQFFEEHDREGSEPAIVVDERLARRFWPDRSPMPALRSEAVRSGPLWLRLRRARYRGDRRLHAARLARYARESGRGPSPGIEPGGDARLPYCAVQGTVSANTSSRARRVGLREAESTRGRAPFLSCRARWNATEAT